jgi:hypothetical protein
MTMMIAKKMCFHKHGKCKSGWHKPWNKREGKAVEVENK